MSRSVKFRRPSPTGHYDHQRSDSGFSDSESRTSNADNDYDALGYEDAGIFSIRQALDSARKEAKQYRGLYDESKANVESLRKEAESAKAHARALENELENKDNTIDTLTRTNKDLIEENKEHDEAIRLLQESLKEATDFSRKGSGGSSPSESSATAAESADEKKVRRSASKRRKDSAEKADREKEKEKERGRDRGPKEKERDRERRKEKERAAAQVAQEETERLRKRFNARDDEIDAKSNGTSKSLRARHDSTYVESLGPSLPRPSAQGAAPSPSRQYAQTAYAKTQTYPSYPAPSVRSGHPTVFVPGEYPSYNTAEDEDATYPHSRSTRHPR
ncbi:uncharacterized protein C8A04DRAFT_14617 [Dichotomopilus funicola]|uniref:Uncharacterized protein n=1 Tax=Dichotomopilus funicola TaxID=1934379 RepID=A0AAN6UXD2_9PEZI|nr:hypothetical protein C8A04DRAFT_14617 [Dichotomopilus funicola]